MSLHYLLFSNKSHTTCAVTPAKHSPHAFLLCSIFSFLSVTSALFSHFLISILCSSEQRVRISSRKEECLILHVLHVLQLYISLAWRRVFLSQRSGCLGRVLGTIQRFLGKNNRSYRPHSGDNTLSSFLPFLSLPFTMSHH